IVRIFYLVHLQTDAGVGAQRGDLFARQRVAVNVLPVKKIIHRHDVWPAFGDTAEPSQTPFPKDCLRFSIFQPSDIHGLLLALNQTFNILAGPLSVCGQSQRNRARETRQPARLSPTESASNHGDHGTPSPPDQRATNSPSL